MREKGFEIEENIGGQAKGGGVVGNERRVREWTHPPGQGSLGGSLVSSTLQGGVMTMRRRRVLATTMLMIAIWLMWQGGNGRIASPRRGLLSITPMHQGLHCFRMCTFWSNFGRIKFTIVKL